MTNLSSTNVNAYLAARSSDAAEYDQMATDLEANFLGALQSRFTVSPPQVDIINFMAPAFKTALTSAFRICADHLAGGPGRSVTFTTAGFGEQPPTTYATVTGEVKVEGEVKYPSGETTIKVTGTVSY
jgi:hypothetical protein